MDRILQIYHYILCLFCYYNKLINQILVKLLILKVHTTVSFYYKFTFWTGQKHYLLLINIS